MIQFGHTTPKARKEHLCSLCSRVIEPGETYDRYRLVGDDGPYTFTECAHCRSLVRLYMDDFCYDPHLGYSADDIWEREWVDTMHQARCRVMFLRRWRRRDGALYPVPVSPPPGEGGA